MDHLSADSGPLLLREIMERTGIVEWMDERLLNLLNPLLITYLLRTSLLLLGQRLARPGRQPPVRHDRSFRVANDTRRGMGALEPDSVLPSQPTLSWFGVSVERADQPGGGA